MKKLIFFLGFIVFVTNLLFGIILSDYMPFNICVNSIVIVATTILIYLLHVIKMKDAFVIAQSIIFSFFGIVEFFFGCFAPQRIENNWFLLVVIVLIVFESTTLIVTNILSNVKD